MAPCDARLSIGSHEHTIPWDKLRYDTRPREQEVHDYWRIPPYWGS